MRKELNVLSEMDAGNYNTPIPYTKADYKTPYQIHESIKKGKRVYSEFFETPLPRITTGYSFAMGVDWDKLYSGRFWNKSGSDEKENDDANDESGEDGIVKDLHVPFFTDRDIDVMPAKMNICLFFTAKDGRQPTCNKRNDNGGDGDGVRDSCCDGGNEARIGVLVVANEAICDKVAQCGIIDEDSTSSKTAEITTYTECSKGRGRRSSIVDFSPGALDLESLSVELLLAENDGDSDAEGKGVTVSFTSTTIAKAKTDTSNDEQQ